MRVRATALLILMCACDHSNEPPPLSSGKGETAQSSDKPPTASQPVTRSVGPLSPQPSSAAALNPREKMDSLAPLRKLSARDTPDLDDFVGADACGDCHQDTLDIWKATTHGRGRTISRLDYPFI